MGSVSVLSKIFNLTNELRAVLPKVVFKEIKTDADYAHLYKSEIIIADFDLVKPHLELLENTKWLQGTWAGIDAILPHLKNLTKRDFIITRYSGIHFGRIMSEYVVANIVNYERKIFDVYENKKQKIWTQEGQISQYRCISDMTIGILGIGNIGNIIAKFLHSFGAIVWGFGRRETIPNTEEYQHYEQYCTITKLPLLLQKCDYIINVLPNTPDTTGLLNGKILQNCAGKKTVLINIGRGNIIKEEDLINALRNNWLSAAILDVFNTEPLPTENELWNMDQVFITPHTAGMSRAKDIAEQFSINFKYYTEGKLIPTQLNVERNY